MILVLQTANVTADAKNCFYPNRVEITSGDELKVAAGFDHVCGEFKKNYRNISNFIKSNVIVMDCDNDHTDNPDEWITFEKLEEMLDDINYAAVPSRNHMKEKGGRTARPKFHVYTKKTSEWDGEKYVTVTADFRKYPDVETSIADHSAYMLGAMNGKVKRYEGLKGCTDYRKAVQIIKDGGYATSPDYVEKICSIIEKWGLTKWDCATGDTGNAQSKPMENEKGMTNADCPFLVRVSISDLNIRKGAGTNTAKTGKYTGKGVFTIVEVRQGKGSDKGWGRLKSGAGWISLDYCKKV